MIYNTDISIPTLCPIQFQGPGSLAFYPKQNAYIGKISSETDFSILISADQFNSIEDFTLRVKSQKGKNIATYTLLKITLSNGIYYAKCIIDAPSYPRAEIIQFGLYLGNTLLADSVYYEANPRAERHYKTLYYTNSVNDWGTIFGNYTLLVEAGFNPNDMSFKNLKEDFQDQEATNHVVYAQPYYTETLSIGGVIGIPNWLATKINALLMCDTIKLDGRQYEPAKGASLEKIDQTYDGLARYKIELQRKNSYSQEIRTEAESNKEFSKEFSTQFD